MNKKSTALKSKINTLSISTKFTLVITLVTLIILIVNVLIFVNINYMIREIDDIYDSNVMLNEITDNLQLVRESLLDYLNTKSTESMEGYYRYEQELKDSIGYLNDKTLDNDGLLYEKNIRNLTESYIRYTEEAIEAKRGRNIEKYRIYYEESEKVYGYVSKYIDNLNNERFKENATMYRMLSNSLRYTEALSFVIFVLIAIFGIVLVSIICNNITTPLINLASAAKQVSVGDYNIDIGNNSSKDEVGIVTDAFEVMVESVKENIDKLKENMEKERQMKEKELMMEAHLKDARLKYLQAQINPHFLFNTLNAGAQLAMLEGADRAYEYIQQVANFFRYNIKKDNDEVSLEEEIELVDTYIYILNVRFSGEIGYEKDVDEELLGAKLPGMSLQPIVENAVNYGIRNVDYPGVITLSVKRMEDEICISIKDNGAGMTKERISEVLSRNVSPNNSENDSNGIGLDNVISRLELMYGRDNVLDIISDGENCGTEVRIYIPAQVGE